METQIKYSLFAVNETVRSRFGLRYTILEALDEGYYKCKRFEDGKVKILHESNLRKLE